MDPREEKRKAEAAAEAERLTFKAVSDLYLKAKETKMRSSTYKAAKAYFDGKWAPLHRNRSQKSPERQSPNNSGGSSTSMVRPPGAGKVQPVRHVHLGDEGGYGRRQSGVGNQ